jgi:hypothetical protein
MTIRTIILTLSTLLLGGCSSSGMLEKMGMGGGSPPPQQTIQSGNPLAMPPDLQLKAPNRTAETYEPNTAKGAPVVDNEVAAATPAEPAPAPEGDVYQQYGIDKMKPDGKPKTKAELDKELKAAVVKRKQQQNPNYGTIKNLGSIFSDG